MTFDPQIYTKYWLFDYIPELKKYYNERLSNVNELESLLTNICKRKAKDEVFRIPYDCCDWFSASAWKRPEIFLNDRARKSMSPFSYIDDAFIKRGLKKLQKDLEDKTFYNKYEKILNNNDIDIGCRFIIV